MNRVHAPSSYTGPVITPLRKFKIRCNTGQRVTNPQFNGRPIEVKPTTSTSRYYVPSAVPIPDVDAPATKPAVSRRGGRVATKSH